MEGGLVPRRERQSTQPSKECERHRQMLLKWLRWVCPTAFSDFNKNLLLWGKGRESSVTLLGIRRANRSVQPTNCALDKTEWFPMNNVGGRK